MEDAEACREWFCEKCAPQEQTASIPTSCYPNNNTMMEIEAASLRKWLCAFCTVTKMKENSNPLTQVMTRLESIERKMETTVSAPHPARSYAPCSTTYGCYSMEGGGDITRGQASAREAGAGKLPTFSGNPEEWGMFITTFEETTQLCGFSDRENHRLLKELGLEGSSKPLCLSWTGGQLREEKESVETSITISETRDDDRKFTMPA
uniref:Uncharacterized protein n=1 Tax=Anopheles epiroticus TaxID=199890 RepID=A0A182PX59_9DIPT